MQQIRLIVYFLFSATVFAVALSDASNWHMTDLEEEKEDEDDTETSSSSSSSTLTTNHNISTHWNDKLMQNNCGIYRRKKHKNRIAGGYSAFRGGYPSYVRVISKKNNETDNSTVCGGTILNERLILTAAHCLEKRPISTHVKAGSVSKNHGKIYQIKETCLPEIYQRNSRNYDVAVLITERPIKFNEFIQPACLPSLDMDPDKQFSVVGFGGSHKRLQVLPIKLSDECPFDLGTNVLCFTWNKAKYVGDTCPGDSGGPVYEKQDGKQTIIGIVKGGSKGCTAGLAEQFSVSMNIFALRKTINKLVEKCYDFMANEIS